MLLHKHTDRSFKVSPFLSSTESVVCGHLLIVTKLEVELFAMILERCQLVLKRDDLICELLSSSLNLLIDHLDLSIRLMSLE